MNYQERFYQLLHYIDEHIDEELTVEHLSDIACLSKYHFHRQFSALLGITAFAYIRQARMKRACYQLAFKKQMKIIDIALINRYESSEAFSRAFSQAMGQSPSQFRENPQWAKCNEKEQQVKRSKAQMMQLKQANKSKHSVEIVDFDEITVASLMHIGPIELITHSIQSFIEWRIENNLPPTKSRTFNIVYDDPAVVEPEKYRCELCVSIDSDVHNNKYGIVSKTIPAGRCARIRHIGSDDGITETISYLYSQWLVNSEQELRDYPLIFERINFFLMY
ncbi:AraC family transcriptional regulator [Psychromonas sp. KJ10-10]|uniref:AraC family transcriptional regulator n=1 Tax=Psychromonas sp. KJ10-10 TaxID=3391823 RepID=UPI0039B3EB7C